MNAMDLQRLYGIRPDVAAAWAPLISEAMNLAQCTTRDRQACFLAQVGHESVRLRHVREIWGPTKQQQRYEPTTTLSRRLGNTEPGDGARYMGRGLLQITGRANYAMTTVRMRDWAGEVPDFEQEPARLESRRWAALSAGLFWRVNKLNRWVDAQDFAELTRRVNGGYNGLADRQALLARALAVL